MVNQPVHVTLQIPPALKQIDALGAWCLLQTCRRFTWFHHLYHWWGNTNYDWLPNSAGSIFLGLAVWIVLYLAMSTSVQATSSQFLQAFPNYCDLWFLLLEMYFASWLSTVYRQACSFKTLFMHLTWWCHCCSGSTVFFIRACWQGNLVVRFRCGAV